MALTPTIAVATVLAYPVGQAVHEFCHAAVAAMLGGDPTIHVSLRRPMAVSYDLTAHGVRDITVRLAPLWVGLTVAAGVVAVSGWPATQWSMLPAAIVWASCTLTGGRQDWAPVLDALYRPCDTDMQRLMRDCAIILVAMVALYTPFSEITAPAYGMLAALAYGFGGVVLGALKHETKLGSP